MTVTQDIVFKLKVCAYWLTRRLRAVVLFFSDPGNSQGVTFIFFILFFCISSHIKEMKCSGAHLSETIRVTFQSRQSNIQAAKFSFLVQRRLDVTKTGNGERESGNECTAVIPIRIQNRLLNAT